jgi:hypothetical protein
VGKHHVASGSSIRVIVLSGRCDRRAEFRRSHRPVHQAMSARISAGTIDLPSLALTIGECGATTGVGDAPRGARRWQAPRGSLRWIGVLCLAGVVAGLLSGCAVAHRPNGTPSAPPRRANALACAESSPHIACRRVLAMAVRADPPELATHRGVLFGVRTFGLIIKNAGTPAANTFTVHTESATFVRPDSSAMVMAISQSQPHPATAQDARIWRRLGFPRVVPKRRPQIANLPKGAYDFAPQGATLTYSAVAHLPANPTALRRRLAIDLAGRPGRDVGADASLMQYGYLLAIGPLTPQERRALLRVLASLPRLKTCRGPRAKRVQKALRICAPGLSTDTELTFAATTGVVCQIVQRLATRSWLYPHIQPGEVTNTVQFRLKNTTSGCPK